jgi:hypothetical protein
MLASETACKSKMAHIHQELFLHRERESDNEWEREGRVRVRVERESKRRLENSGHERKAKLRSTWCFSITIGQ